MSGIARTVAKKQNKIAKAKLLARAIMELEARVKANAGALMAMEEFINKLCVYLAVTPEKIMAEPETNPTAIGIDAEVKSE